MDTDQDMEKEIILTIGAIGIIIIIIFLEVAKMKSFALFVVTADTAHLRDVSNI